jgi:hypothetical protein
MEKKNLNSRIDARLFKVLKDESDRLGMKFERFIEDRLRATLAVPVQHRGSVRKLGLPPAERQV